MLACTHVHIDIAPSGVSVVMLSSLHHTILPLVSTLDHPQHQTIFDYYPSQPDELCLMAGDVIRVFKKMVDGKECSEACARAHTHTHTHTHTYTHLCVTVFTVHIAYAGWYYGENMRNLECGWFPSNYTFEMNTEHKRRKNLRQEYKRLSHHNMKSISVHPESAVAMGVGLGEVNC